tara:strand:+ start:18490 stop:20352 length:1863 start_codon:yes stop_codon:yes gene_type:complete
MAIIKSFAGRNIRKPGGYSRTLTDNSGGSPIESNDTIFIIGESSLGQPGDVEGIQEFTAGQLSSLVAKYGSGPIVDCANAAVKPSRTPGISGAGKILVWKTNSSTQASLDVNSVGDVDVLYSIKDLAVGKIGNDISVTISAGTAGDQKAVKISQLGLVDENLGENEDLPGISIEYTGDATTAVMAITGVSQTNKVLSVVLAGDETDGSAGLSINLREYSLKGLADFINGKVGYSCSLSTNKYASKSGNELDAVSAVDVTSAVILKRIQYEILEVINASARVEAVLGATVSEGGPKLVAGVFLSGGAQGASINSDFSNGLAQSLAEDYNVALPAVSRDASDEITAEGFTDVGSTYDIDSILAGLDAHLRLRGDVEARKEAQGMGGIRDAAKANVFTSVESLGSELVQIAMQDVQVVGADGSLYWGHPHVQAAMFAGVRLGTAVGEPLTHKRIAANAVGHVVDPETGISSGDFNSDLDSAAAIDAGVTYTEKSGSINRIVVDNTTYGVDGSFVFNRGSVMEAAQFVAKDVRGVAEEVFIGKKVSNGAAQSIKNVIRNRLIELNAPDVNIITASDDAPQGFVEETFVVTVEGNTAYVEVEVKPVQGLDFIFITFTMGDISQAA